MYLLVHSFSYCLSLLPTRVLEFFAKALTWTLYSLCGLRKKTILKNLDIAFKEEKTLEEKKHLGFLSFYHFILTAFEFLSSRKGDIASKMEFVNEEPLVEALKQGRGAYVIALHMSNWEAAASGVSKKIKPVHVVVKKVGSPSVDRFVTDLRTRNKMHVVKRKSTGDAVRSMKKVLNQGDIVAVMLDQARPGEPFLDFFGLPAKTNTSFAAISRRLQAPIFIAYSRRSSMGCHKLIVKEEIQLQNTEDKEKDVLENSLLLNKEIEACIRECPEQYFWLHDRWKHSPGLKS